MADKFCNGLKLIAPSTAQCGRTFSRWLVEYLTQIGGWTIYDAVSGNWSNYVDTGGDGSTDVSDPTLFSIGSSSYNFSSADIGGYLTISGFSTRFASRTGIYRIDQVISSKVVKLGVERSVHEDGLPLGATALSWKLWWPTASYVPTSSNVIVLAGTGTSGSGYSFHLHIIVRGTHSYFPEFRMSPFASWDAGTHAWAVGDTRYTVAKGIDDWNSSLSNVDTVRVWAAVDADRVVLMMRVEDDYYSWHFVYLGEIDVQNEVLDPNPCILWSGSNRGNSTVGDDNNTLFGTDADSSVYNGGVWLANDDVTSVTGYGTFAHCSPSSNLNWVSDTQRVWQEPTRRRLRQTIVCESRTAGFMELRGTLRRVWIAPRDTSRLLVYGTNGEYLHVVGGVTIPWFNSKVFYERG